jgi:hypothetical protein
MDQGTLMPMDPLSREGRLEYKRAWLWVLTNAGDDEIDVIFDMGAGYGLWMLFVWFCLRGVGRNVPVRGPEYAVKAVRLGEKLIELVQDLFPELDVVLSHEVPPHCPPPHTHNVRTSCTSAPHARTLANVVRVAHSHKT